MNPISSRLTFLTILSIVTLQSRSIDAQLGVRKEKFDAKLQKRLSQDTESNSEDIDAYELDSGHKVDIRFQQGRAVSIRVFGKKMYPSELEKIISDATPEPVDVNQTKKWSRDKFLCSVYPQAIRQGERFSFVQTGVRPVVQGGQRYAVHEETYLNGLKIGDRFLGTYKTPRSLHYVPTGYTVPYNAADGAVRMILKLGDDATAYATYDLTVDSDRQPFSESVTVYTPNAFFADALTNREQLYLDPVAPLGSSVSSLSSIPYDRAVASFLTLGEQRAMTQKQYLQTMCACIANSNVNLDNFEEQIDKINADLLARELCKRIRRVGDNAKVRTIQVFAKIKSKKAIPILTSLRQNSTFRKHANWAMGQIKFQ